MFKSLKSLELEKVLEMIRVAKSFENFYFLI